MRAIVGGDVQKAIVGPGPEHAFLHRRFGQGEDHVVIFYAGDVVLDRTAARLLFALIIAAEIAADLASKSGRGRSI